MLFLDYSFLSGSKDSIPLTPTVADNMTDTIISNAMFDDLYMTLNTDIKFDDEGGGGGGEIDPPETKFPTRYHITTEDVDIKCLGRWISRTNGEQYSAIIFHYINEEGYHGYAIATNSLDAYRSGWTYDRYGGLEEEADVYFEDVWKPVYVRYMAYPWRSDYDGNVVISSNEVQIESIPVSKAFTSGTSEYMEFLEYCQSLLYYKESKGITPMADGEPIIIPEDWDFKTILHAKFNNSVVAGDLEDLVEFITGFLIKRRTKDEFEWMTIEYFPVEDKEDFNVVFQDKTAAIGTEYEYAFVPIISNVEGAYSSTSIIPTSNMLVILDKDEVWATAITDGFCDTTRTYPINMLTTLNSKYPTSVRNTLANYDNINVTGTWIPNRDGSECEIVDINDDTNIGFITKWSKRFIDFLTNDKGKILKNTDGRMWLCHLSSDVTDSADTVYNKRKLSFTMTEIGDATSNEDLYTHGFINENTEPYW